MTPLALLLLATLAGCGATSPYTAAQRGEMAAIAYPIEAPSGEPVDALLTRRGSRIQIANRDVEPIGPGQLWLNRAWLAPLPRIEPGGKRMIALNRFINRFEEPFPTGTFLSREKTRPIVLAEAFNPEQPVRVPLIVRLEDDAER